MSETTQQVATMVFDGDQEIAAEAIDGTVEVMEIMRNNPKTLVAVAIVAAVAGGVGGYFIAKRKLRDYYEELSTQEIQEAKAFYASLNKVDLEGNELTPQQVLDSIHGEGTAAEAVAEYQGRVELDEEDEELLKRTESKVKTPFGEATVTTEETSELQNVFLDPTFDLKEEVKYRTPDRPYIITHDEFYSGEPDYDTVSLTYYETDQVLCDERDQPIDEKDRMIGEDHLMRFGAGSKDRNTLYVRNQRLEIDYEITRSPGSYLEEVLAMTPDNSPGPDGG